MPLMKIQTSTPVSAERKQAFLKEATKIMVEAAGKKESHVMIVLEQMEASMGGEMGPTAFAEVRSMVGLTHEVNNNVSARLFELLEKELGVPNERFFINFIQIPEGCWGWKGGVVVWDHPQKKWIIK
jgi:phenylpyruvate tautomerase